MKGHSWVEVQMFKKKLGTQNQKQKSCKRKRRMWNYMLQVKLRGSLTK